MRSPWLKSIILLTLPLALLVFIATGCSSDVSTANDLVRDSDSLRVSASDKLRKSTAATDGMVRIAAAGQALPAAQTKATTDTSAQSLNNALADLSSRDAKLQEAEALGLSDKYREYLRLLRESNNGLMDTVNAALEIPRLLEQEQYSLAGWDETRAQEVVKQTLAKQQNIETLYNASETLRGNAEQLRADNSEDFGA